jgi:hypothetical protein
MTRRYFLHQSTRHPSPAALLSYDQLTDRDLILREVVEDVSGYRIITQRNEQRPSFCSITNGRVWQETHCLLG